MINFEKKGLSAEMIDSILRLSEKISPRRRPRPVLVVTEELNFRRQISVEDEKKIFLQ